MSRKIVGPPIAALVVGVAIAAAPSLAQASGHDRWSTPVGERFAAAVLTCEERSVTAPALRSCVGNLVPPNTSQAEILDLWRIFNSCLGLMPNNVDDAMYPESYYEDLVNDCLGL